MAAVSEPYSMSASIVSLSLGNFLIVIVGPSRPTGGTTALTREPSGSRASTVGELLPMRRPSGSTMRSMIRRICALFSKTIDVFSSRPPFSTYTLSGAFTITSVISGSSISGWIGP